VRLNPTVGPLRIEGIAGRVISASPAGVAGSGCRPSRWLAARGWSSPAQSRERARGSFGRRDSGWALLTGR